MSMLHCIQCGSEMHETAKACPKCGAIPVLPPGVRGWSWGAFLLNGIWAIFNGPVWVGLLAFVPYFGLIMAIVLGVKGREWAWRAKRWESVDHFQQVQRAWSVWSLVLILGVFVIGMVAAIAVATYASYVAQSSGAHLGG